MSAIGLQPVLYTIRKKKRSVCLLYLAYEFHFVSLDIFDGENLEFREEMKTEIIHSISQDRFLNQQHVTPRLLNLLAHIKQIRALLFQSLIHLSIIIHNDLIFHLQSANALKPVRYIRFW